MNKRKWKIKPSTRLGLYWWNRIVGGNGEIVFSSQVYFSKGNCLKAAERASEELGLEVVLPE